MERVDEIIGGSIQSKAEKKRNLNNTNERISEWKESFY